MLKRGIWIDFLILLMMIMIRFLIFNELKLKLDINKKRFKNFQQIFLILASLRIQAY